MKTDIDEGRIAYDLFPYREQMLLGPDYPDVWKTARALYEVERQPQPEAMRSALRLHGMRDEDDKRYHAYHRYLTEAFIELRKRDRRKEAA
jgi:hypothetical protein